MNQSTPTRAQQSSPVGRIAEVHGPVVVIACQRLPPLRQALSASLDHETCLFEVHQHLDEHHLRAITLHGTTGLQRGMAVFDTGAPLQVPVAPQCLGRLLNIFGEPLDGGPPLPATQRRKIHSSPVALHQSLGASGMLGDISGLSFRRTVQNENTGHSRCY